MHLTAQRTQQRPNDCERRYSAPYCEDSGTVSRSTCGTFSPKGAFFYLVMFINKVNALKDLRKCWEWEIKRLCKKLFSVKDFLEKLNFISHERDVKKICRDLKMAQEFQL